LDFFRPRASSFFKTSTTPQAVALNAEAPAPIEPDPLFEPLSGQQMGRALLSVTVPEEARVYVNGHLTQTPGSVRRYVSSGLAGGHSYTYQVRAEVVRDGQPVSQTKTVRLRAGQAADLAFHLPADSVVETLLALNVPQDAKVRLDGRTTKATGPVRKFATTKLQRGEQWTDYRVAVSIERNGQTLTREERVTLIGGQTRELTFDFVDQRLALR
jgi:uncharacterized protein (TIGR03000 family)